MTALIAGSGVTVRAVDGVFIAMFGWHPSRSPMFGTGSTEVAFGLAPAVSSYPLGPFARPRERALTVALTVARQTGFPGNGLDLIRAAVNAVVAGYGIGQWTSWKTLGQGSRNMATALQFSDLDSVLDSVWFLPSADHYVKTPAWLRQDAIPDVSAHRHAEISSPCTAPRQTLVQRHATPRIPCLPCLAALATP